LELRDRIRSAIRGQGFRRFTLPRHFRRHSIRI
jgi:hypothetical protein